MNGYNYNYTVENSALYVILPISYAGSYIAELTDAGLSCITYGISIISSNKFRVYSRDKYNTENLEDWHGHLITIGF